MSSTATTALRRSEAGRSGADVRSDVHVTFEERSSGGIQIDLRSRVELYYGERIRQQVSEVVRSLGVEHAHLTVVDEGALPFVIPARVEAAVRRAGLATDKQALPESVALPQPSPRDRLRRSRLYLPGNEPKYFVNAGSARAGCGHPRSGRFGALREKDAAARMLVRNALRAVDFAQSSAWCGSTNCRSALPTCEEIVPESPDLILIPKVESAAAGSRSCPT